ncbi:MAG: YfhO family protein [Ferruginibacter sp.]
MKNINFKSLLQHVIAIAVFAIVATIYCKPALNGKVLQQHDTQGWKGMAQQSFEVKEKTGRFPLWTNSMFGGMPTYQIAMEGTSKIGVVIGTAANAYSLWLPLPIAFFFIASLSFYILCIVAGINPWVGMLGGLAYAYSTYNPIIVSVGHNTKMLSIAYAPAVIAGVLMLFQKKYITGLLMTAFFAAVMIGQNHFQIVYYLLIIIAAISIGFIIYSFKNNNLKQGLTATALALLGGMIGLGINAGSIMPTYDYAKETMRGGVSQLSLNAADSSGNKTKGGLDKDYAMRWSAGKMETFTFLVPGLFGGSNGGDEHSSNAKMVQKLSEIGVPEENALAMTNGYSYWGNMSNSFETTSGPVYLGAIICFLFILGLFYVDNWIKWPLAVAALFGIVLAWGNSFMGFNSFMLDHLPFYSKFRAPSMAFVIPQICIPILAVFALDKWLKEKEEAFAFKNLRLAGITTGALILLLGAFWLMADYTGKADKDIKQNFVQSFARTAPGQQPSPQMMQQAEETAKDLMTALREDRKNETGRDLLRTILFLATAAAVLWLFMKKKINASAAAIVLAVLSFFDLVGIANRYLNNSNFVEAEEFNNVFTLTTADQQILKDPDHANFRVFNQTSNFTNESVTSYHHNSIGGYHPAKLGLYQDIIEHQLGKGNMNVFNMLNTKYFIMQDAQGQSVAQQNPYAYGTCWLVKNIKFVKTPNEEMMALDSTNLRETAVANESFSKQIGTLPQFDSTASIRLVERQNDNIKYESNSTTPQFAVFSEMYYNRGWNAYIDGKQTGYAKVNYVLRGLSLPAGKHNIEFKFEPASYYTGNNISFWSNLALFFLAAAGLAMWIMNRKKS